MKGVVFREFIDFVEDQAGEEVVEDMITRAAPASGAAYTVVGKYDWREMVQMVSALSDITQAPVPDLVRAFGRHLFGRLQSAYPGFFKDGDDAFSFLSKIEEEIHVEVLKLYPDAELPTLDVRVESADALTVRYKSCRPFGDLCMGMIEGCGDHFGESFDLVQTPTPDGMDINVKRITAKAA